MSKIIHDENRELSYEHTTTVYAKDAGLHYDEWAATWKHDQQPTMDRNIDYADIRVGLAEFVSSHDNKPMFALWVNDRKPDGRTINVAQDGSRGISIRKKYGEMWPFRSELQPEFINDVLKLVHKIKESDEFYVTTVTKGLREKLKSTGRPSQNMTLQELVAGS